MQSYVSLDQMDPLSIATAVAGAIGLIDNIVLRIQAARDSVKVEEFRNLIHGLRAVIKNVQIMVRRNPCSRSSEEQELWKSIGSIVNACTSILEQINSKLPPHSVRWTQALKAQIREHLSGITMDAQKTDLDRYMQCLTVSLTTISIKHSEQIRDSQGVIVTKLQALLAVKEGTQEILSNLPEIPSSPKSQQSTAVDLPQRSEEEGKQIINEWNKSVNHAIGSTEDLADLSLTSTKRSRILSWWTKVARLESSEPQPSEDSDKPMTTVDLTDEREFAVIPPSQASAEEPELENVSNTLIINPDDLQAHIEEYQQDFEKALNTAKFDSFFYNEAVSIQRKLISFFEQREEHYGTQFSNKADQQEILANTLIKQRAPDGLWEAARIFDQLLGNRPLDKAREARFNEGLAKIFSAFGKWDKAEIRAHHALNIRLKIDEDHSCIDALRSLLLHIYESSGQNSAANAMKKKYPSLSTAVSDEPTQTGNSPDEIDGFPSMRRYLSIMGFPSSSPEGEEGARHLSISELFDAAHPETGETPIQMAARESDTEAIAELIDAGADLEATNKSGATPLLIAASTKSRNAVALLVNRGSDLSAKDARGDTALHQVQDSRGGTKAAKILLDHKPSLVFAKNNMSMTALHFAALYGNLDMVDVLLSYGAEINAADMVTLDTPLHLAIHRNDPDMVKKLEENCADMYQANVGGEKPIDICRQADDPIGIWCRNKYPPVKRKRNFLFWA